VRDGARCAPALVDSFGRQHTYLRVSLADQCNFRCRYCVPATTAEEEGSFGPPGESMSTAAVLRAIEMFVRAGVTKVRLTGGEPTLRRDLGAIAAGIGALRSEGLQSVGITTNGLLLDRVLPELGANGCTQLNISFDTLMSAKFTLLSRRPSKWHDRVVATVDRAIDDPRFEVKLNCVVMRGFNDDEIADFVDLARRRPVEVRFLEFMPFAGNSWAEDRLVPVAEVFRAMREAEPGLVPIPAPAAAVARLFTGPGWQGRVGVISAMTDSFCSGCNRLRLTSDGMVKNCLFGEDEWSMRDLLERGASDEELLETVAKAVGAKHYAHGGNAGPEEIQANALSNRPMIRIGG